MTVHNMMEELVSAGLKDLMSRQPKLQSLEERDRSDIMAIALNRLPPKYVSTFKGEMFAKTQLRSQLETDVYRELSYAAEIVLKQQRRTDF